MFISNDTYVLDVEFPFHMNQIWMKKHHNSKAHYHWHSFYEISYVYSGQANCFVDGERYPVYQGDIVVFNIDEVHGWEMEEDIQLLVMTFSPEFILSHQNWDKDYLNFFNQRPVNFVNILNHELDNTKIISTSVKNIWDEWKNDKFGKNMMIKAELLKILTLLSRHFEAEKFVRRKMLQKRMQLKRLDKVFDYLEKNYMDKITLEEVSSIANMNASYFSRYFHNIMNMKFIDYLTQKRCEKHCNCIRV